MNILKALKNKRKIKKTVTLHLPDTCHSLKGLHSTGVSQSQVLMLILHISAYVHPGGQQMVAHVAESLLPT